MKYNHWFWNSNFMNWFAKQAGYFVSWIWQKQYQIR